MASFPVYLLDILKFYQMEYIFSKQCWLKWSLSVFQPYMYFLFEINIFEEGTCLNQDKGLVCFIVMNSVSIVSSYISASVYQKLQRVLCLIHAVFY